MPTQLEGLSRYELLVKRKSLLARLSVLRGRRTYWQALTRAAAALSREYAHDDAELSAHMNGLSFRSVTKERETMGEHNGMLGELERVNRILHKTSSLMTAQQLKEETDALYPHDGQEKSI